MTTCYSANDIGNYHKIKEFPKWKIVVSWLLIFTVTDVFKLIPSQAFANIYFHAVMLVGWLAFFLYIIKYGFNNTLWWIAGYCILLPIYGSLKAEYLFDQSFVLGIASLRYLSLILCGYILVLMKYPYHRLINQVNVFNLWVAGLSIVLVLILGVSTNVLDGLFVNTYAIETNAVVTQGYHAVRGIRFTKCSEVIYVSLVYYLLDIVRNGFKKKNTLSLLLLLIYMLFVHKGRQPIAVLCIVYVIAYIKLRGASMLKMLLTVVPVSMLCVVTIVFPQVLDSFSTILEGDRSADFSTLARIWSVESVIPYILDNPILGIGNLSPHYKEGFHGILGDTFYIADIGIIGAMARGGIVLILIYFGLYLSLYVNSGRVQNIANRQFLKYMILVQICLLVIFFHDTLNGDGSLRFALIFYPLFTGSKVLRKLRICEQSL